MGICKLTELHGLRAVLSDLNTLYLGLVYVCLFLNHGDKVPETNNLQEERFVLVHDFRGLSSKSLVPNHGDSTVWWAKL